MAVFDQPPDVSLCHSPQDDPDWYAAEDEKEEDAGEGELYEFG